MGFSLSASFAIIGVSLLISLEILSGSILPELSDINESQQHMLHRKIAQVQTDFTITDVNTTANQSNYDYEITVENTGSTTIEMEKCMLLFNGSVYPFVSSVPYLFPQTKTDLFLYNISGTGTKRIKIVSQQSIESYYEINI